MLVGLIRQAPTFVSQGSPRLAGFGTRLAVMVMGRGSGTPVNPHRRIRILQALPRFLGHAQATLLLLARVGSGIQMRMVAMARGYSYALHAMVAQLLVGPLLQ